MRLTKTSDSRRGTIASPIMPMPINRIPRPAMIPPANWTCFLFTNRISATPTKVIKGASSPISRAISCPVTVVPIFAPMIIQTACFKVISPELTKPTTITVVAEEDWITAVIPAPTHTPRKRFAVRRSRICFIRLPAAASRLTLIICIPYKNSARPPSKPKTILTLILFPPPS